MLEHLTAMNRRTCLQIGAAGVTGAALPAWAETSAVTDGPGVGKAKSVLLVLLSGGLSQLDTVDPKPDAAQEIRGDFKSMSTPLPGVVFTEHLPLLAQQLNRWSIVRTMTHGEYNHLLAMHVALTGRPTPIPRAGSDLDRVESRFDFPNYAAALDAIRPRNDGIPTGVSLPNYYIEGPLTWPGQHAGFLGAKHDPWQINQDPNDPKFKIDSLTLQEGVTPPRLVSRRQLLEQLEQGTQDRGTGRLQSFAEQQSTAFSLLTSARVAEAFQMDRETPETRERYGRNKFGQSLLLSRRLVQAGVPIVQAAMGIVQTWDTHVDNWGRLKNTLLPQLDRGLAALMDDLSASGRLEETLVIVMGEFGRTPRISTLPGSAEPGRDHWPHAYSIFCAGAGVRGGQVLGQTDAVAGYPITRAWTPADVCSTIYSALGIPEGTMIMDPLNRPNHLLNGAVMESLYTGRMS